MANRSVWDPWNEMRRLQRDHDADSSDRSYRRQPSPPARRHDARRGALMDVYETDSAIVLVADVPGVRPDGLEVVAERGTLTLRGRVARSEREPEYQEFELGDYFQALTLTEDLDPRGITASLKDGVMRVTVPKSPGHPADEDPDPDGVTSTTGSMTRVAPWGPGRPHGTGAT
jgi:HSP20 family molecular chaperone IbpA